MGFLLPATPREAPSGWTFFSMASVQPIYVVLTAPGRAEGSSLLPLAGLPAEHRDALRNMRRGDAVPSHIVAGLLTLAPPSMLRQQLGAGR